MALAVIGIQAPVGVVLGCNLMLVGLLGLLVVLYINFDEYFGPRK
jgi:hypothetical protein